MERALGKSTAECDATSPPLFGSKYRVRNFILKLPCINCALFRTRTCTIFVYRKHQCSGSEFFYQEAKNWEPWFLKFCAFLITCYLWRLMKMHGIFSKCRSVLWTRGILVRIQIRGSLPLTYKFGFGSGSCIFCQWWTRYQQKLKILLFRYVLKANLHQSSKIKVKKKFKK